jgi:Ca2+-binding RTX toxin-like protein
MRIRRIAVALALGAAATVPAVVLAGPASAADSCVNQFTGASLTATLEGTNGADILDPVSGDVVSAKGGNDVVRIFPGVRNVTICLGDGSDQVVSVGSFPTYPLSVMGGPGDDFIFGSTAADALNGGTGYDTIDGRDGYDTCTNAEATTSCP